MNSSSKRLWRRALLLLPVLFVFVTGAVYWRARHALRAASEQVAAEKYIRFTVRNVEPAANPGFEWISAPAVFSSAARFQDKFYLSGLHDQERTRRNGLRLQRLKRCIGGTLRSHSRSHG